MSGTLNSEGGNLGEDCAASVYVHKAPAAATTTTTTAKIPISVKILEDLKVCLWHFVVIECLMFYYHIVYNVIIHVLCIVFEPRRLFFQVDTTGFSQSTRSFVSRPNPYRPSPASPASSLPARLVGLHTTTR